VGTSGDYAPFSQPSLPGGGFDVLVARAYAADRGLTLELVPFRWAELVADLVAGRFDVVMSGVTVRPERSLAGRFGVPVAESGAVALVAAASTFGAPEDLDRQSVRVAVNRGGHLERVARAHFPHANLRALTPNRAVRDALLGGEADAAITDTLEASWWRRDAPPLRVLGPFTRDRKAYLVRAERPALAADLDAWLLAREADGRLAEWRARFPRLTNAPASATPLSALLAALDERLALMPAVAEAKRARGLAVEAPAREEVVITAGLAAAHTAARAAARPAPPEPALRAFFRAQMEAAKAVQRRTLASEPAVGSAAPDLENELRPALLRIGERAARLLVVLPAPLDCSEVRRRATEEIRSVELEAEQVRALADSVVAVGGGSCSSR
jgi:cyclohexadienyl dehydratase